MVGDSSNCEPILIDGSVFDMTLHRVVAHNVTIGEEGPCEQILVIPFLVRPRDVDVVEAN